MVFRRRLRFPHARLSGRALRQRELGDGENDEEASKHEREQEECDAFKSYRR